MSLLVISFMAGSVLLLYRSMQGKARLLTETASNVQVETILEFGQAFLNDLYVLDARCSPKLLNTRLNALTKPRLTAITIDGRSYDVRFGPITPKGRTASAMEDPVMWPRSSDELSDKPADAYIEMSAVTSNTRHVQWLALIDTCSIFGTRWVQSPGDVPPKDPSKAPSVAPAGFFSTKAGTEMFPSDLRSNPCAICQASEPSGNRVLGVYGWLSSLSSPRNFKGTTNIDAASAYTPVGPDDADWLRLVVDQKSQAFFWPFNSSGPPLCAADLTGDGRVDSSDVRLLQKQLLGFVTRIPSFRSAEHCIAPLGSDYATGKSPTIQ